MAITQANLDYMASKGCKLTISGVEAYAGMVIPSAPTFRIDIIDGSLFPIGGSQFITTDTITNYDMKAKKTIIQISLINLYKTWYCHNDGISS